MSTVNLKKYSVRRGYECFNACILNCLAFSDIDVNSSDIFFSASDQPLNYVNNNLEVGHFINVMDYVDNQVYIVDGYAVSIMGNTFQGNVDADTVERAWAAKGYDYFHFSDIKAEKLVHLRQDARKNLNSYLFKAHDKIANMSIDHPQIEILLQVYNLINKIIEGDDLDEQFIDKFFSMTKVQGFIVLENMLWEKVNEFANEYSEDYLKIVNRWNQLLLCLRKHVYSNRQERMIACYEDMVKLAKEENRLLLKAFQL